MDKTWTVELPNLPEKRKRETSGNSLDPLIHGDTSGRSLFLDSLIFVLEHGLWGTTMRGSKFAEQKFGMTSYL